MKLVNQARGKAMARGFAYVDNAGEIDIATVSPTEVGAKVNAIVRLSKGAFIPRETWTEADCDHWLAKVAKGAGKIAPVIIAVEAH